MIVTTRGARDVMDALASGASDRAGRKRRSVRRSRVVLAPRCWRQVPEKHASQGWRWQQARSTGESTK